MLCPRVPRTDRCCRQERRAGHGEFELSIGPRTVGGTAAEAEACVAGERSKTPLVLRRREVLRIAAAGAGLLAAGCGLVTPSRGLGGGALAVMSDQALAPAVQAVADAFAASPGAGHKPVVQIAEPSLTEAYTAMLSGSATTTADVSVVTSEVRRTLQAQTLMINLSPSLAQTDLSSRIYPKLLAYGQSSGRQILLPLFRDPLVVFFNSDAFARAGVDPPAMDWTFERFALLCQQLHQRAAGLVAPVANLTNVYDQEILTAFIHGFGGQTLVHNDTQSGYVAAFAKPAAVEGVDALVALHPYEPSQPSASARPLDLFAQGKVAMYFGHHRDVFGLMDAIGDAFAWDVAPVPQFPIQRVQPVQADGVAALVGDPDRRAASVALTLFTCTPDAQQAAARTGLGVPALTSLAGASSWRQTALHLNNDVFVAHADADIVVPEPMYFLPELQDALRAIVRGAVPAYTALADAATAAYYTLVNWQS